MAYSPEVYRNVSLILEERKKRAESEADRKKEDLYQSVPELRQIDYKISKNFYSMAFSSSDEKIKEKVISENETLNTEKREIILKCGYPENYLEPDYFCKKCKDTGRVSGILCSCYKDLCLEEALKELYRVSQAEKCTFDTFSLQMYTDTGASDGTNPFRRMTKYYDFCKTYANDFTTDSDSLLMVGKTGLGKTHLSLAIATEAVKKGYGVIYSPIQHMISELEKEHFSNGGSSALDRYTNCDLLVMDDLGAEFITSFSVSAVGNIINERLVKSLPTIISTNFSVDEITQKYSERTASRLFGKYRIMNFIGEDIRFKK